MNLIGSTRGVTLLYQDPSKPIAWPALLTEDNFGYLNLFVLVEDRSQQSRKGAGFLGVQLLTGPFHGARGVALQISSSAASPLVGRYAGHRFPQIDKVIKKLVALGHLKHKQMHWLGGQC